VTIGGAVGLLSGRGLRGVDRVRAAERDAVAAVARYRALRAASKAGIPVHGPPCWQRLLLTIVGVGGLLGVLVVGLIAMAFLLPGPLLIVPAAGGLTAVVFVTVRASARRRGPVVRDLVGAVVEVRRADAALRRARERAQGRPAVIRPDGADVPWPAPVTGVPESPTELAGP
jgi:hypothetical protein